MSDFILTPKFRGSYCHLFKPQKAQEEGGKAKYGITIVLPKTHPDTKPFITKLKGMFKAAMIEKFTKELPETALKHYPIRDGDAMVDDDGETRPEWARCWVIPAKSDRQPKIMVMENGARRDAENESEVYSGAWFHASINVFAWKHETGGKGVSISLRGVVKVKDDEAFGGGGCNEEEFDGIPAEAGDEGGDL